MKKSLKRILFSVFSLSLSVLMLAHFSLRAMQVVAGTRGTITVPSSASTLTQNQPVYGGAIASPTQTEYVKDVVFITGDSLADAKTKVPNGYKLVGEDLNEGAEYITAVDDVYLAYSTTLNPEEAVTDIKMMNMNGGFVVSDYEKKTDLNNLSENIQNMVTELKTAVSTFASNYKKGTPGAMAAYRTLSAFTVDEFGGKTLANYFAYSEVTESFLLKLLMNAHTNVLASILSALTMAVQGEKGNTWLDRLAKVEDPYGVTNSLYWDQACALLPHFETFFTTYDSIDHNLFTGPGGPLYTPPDGDGNPGDQFTQTGTNPSVDLTGGEFYYELAHLLLTQYSFGDGTLVSDWLVNDALYEEVMFPLVEVLTPAEYAMMHLCGPLYMIFATAMSESVYQDYANRANEIMQEMGGTCSVWVGVNQDLLRSSIAITDNACRAIMETQVAQEFNNQGDTSTDTLLKTAGLFAAAGLVTLGTGMLALTIFGSSLYAGLLGSAAVAFTSQVAVVASITGCILSATGVAILVVAAVMATVYLVICLIDWISSLYPDLTEIPAYMYDYIVDDSDNGQFLLYEVAKDQDGNPVDVNAKDGKEWHAPYLSRDKAAGAPIKAEFKVKKGGDGRLDEGFGALSKFGNINCENLNLYAYGDDVNGIYVSYRQENLTGDYARGKYLADVKLFTAENEEHCKLNLKNEKYVLYNLNLTPNEEYCTYLGYKTTSKTANALTDIRLAYGYNSTQYSAGGGNLTYGASGSIGDLTLYTTRIKTYGSPILSDFKVVKNRAEAPLGYEPVNMFSGGPAIGLNYTDSKFIEENSPYYLYFLPSQAYVSGTEYLGGIATMYDVPDRENYVTYGKENSIDNAIARMGYQKLASASGNHEMEGALLYTTTFNPYRAIYDIGAMTSGGEMGNYLSETIMYGGVGYMREARFAVTDNFSAQERIGFDSYITKNDSRLYLAGAGKGGNPMTAADIYASDNADAVPEGFKPVNAFLRTGGKAVNVSSRFNYKYRLSTKRTLSHSMSPIYVFIRGEAYQEGKYLSSVSLVSKEQVLNGMEIDCDKVDNSAVMNALASSGVRTVIERNLNLADEDNSTFLGYVKNAAERDPITDMQLYYAGETDANPPASYTKNGVVYHLVSNANLFCYENYENQKCQRVYLYFTTNPAAGSPIVDIKIDNTPILDGWQTVRTQNGKALYDDMEDYASDMWFIHLNRGEETPKYISEIVVGWGSDMEAKAMLLAAGCDYMLTRDLNANVGALSDYVYLGYKRTSDPTKAIRNIIAVHDEEYTSFTKNGATYYKVNGNLNSYTHAFADDIYLFYTKDSKAGNPITSLGTSGSVANWSHGEGGKYVVRTVLNQYGEASDLNRNCGLQSDYIYLLQTRDKTDAGILASMIGKGSIFIIVTFAVASALAVGGIYLVKRKREKKENSSSVDQTGEKE